MRRGCSGGACGNAGCLSSRLCCTSPMVHSPLPPTVQVLSQLDLGDPTVQTALLALLPAPDGGGDENTPPRHANAQGGQGQGLDRLGSLVVEDSNGSMESAGGLAAQLWPLGQVRRAGSGACLSN